MKFIFVFAFIILCASFGWGDSENQEHNQYLMVVSLYNQDALDLTLEQIAEFKTAYPRSDLSDRIALIEARIDQEKGKLASAEEKYTALIKKYPYTRLRDQALFFLGETAFSSQRYAQALQYFQQLRLDFPQSATAGDALYWSGETSFALADYVNAKVLYEKYLLLYPRDRYASHASYSIAWCLLRLGKYDDADRQLNDFVSRYPQSPLIPTAKFVQAMTIFRMGKIAEAEPLFSSLVDQFPGTPVWGKALLYRAECFYKMGKAQQAKTIYQEMLTLKDIDALKENALYGLGWAQMALGAGAEALKTFDRFLSQYSNSALKPSVFYQRGVILETLNDMTAAEKVYLTVAATKPTPELAEAADLGLIRVYFNQKQWGEISQNATAFLAKYPQSANLDLATLYLGEAALHQGETKTAADYFNRVVQSYPQSAFVIDASYQLGVCDHLLGESARAKEVFLSIADHYPHSNYRNEVEFALAELNFRMDQFADAARYYQSLMASADLDPALKEKVIYGNAWAYFKLGDYQKSLSLFSDYIESYHQSRFRETTLFKKGECYFNLKQYVQAQAEFSAFVARYPTSSMTEEARYQIGSVYYKTGEFSKAIDIFKGLEKRWSASASAVNLDVLAKSIFWTGWSYFRQEKYTDAYLAFFKLTETKALQNTPLYKESLLRQGDCLFNLRRFKEALDRYSQVTKMTGVDFRKDSLYGVFLSNLELEDFSNAKQAWKTFSDLYPHDPLIVEMDHRLIEKQSQ